MTDQPGAPRWGGRIVAIAKKHVSRGHPPCWLCGKKIDYTLEPGDPMALTVDHKIPRSKRPDLTLEPSNWAPAHQRCNKRRGNRAPETARRRPALSKLIGSRSRDW